MRQRNNIKLEEIGQNNPFEVPKGYFENFSIRMSDRISETEEAKVTVSQNARLRPALVFASFAGVAIVLLVSVFLVLHHNKPLSSEEMMEAYRYSAIQDVTDEQLAQIIKDRQIAHLAKTDTAQQIKEKQEIIDFLSKENIDINTLIDAQ
jgi:hypothetical protein